MLYHGEFNIIIFSLLYMLLNKRPCSACRGVVIPYTGKKTKVFSTPVYYSRGAKMLNFKTKTINVVNSSSTKSRLYNFRYC